MISSKFSYFLLVIVSTLTISGAHSQSIANASFEDWIDSCAVDQAPVGWTNWSTSGGPDQRGPNCIGNIPAFDGTNFMCLRWASGGSNVSEGVATDISGLTIGETYTISFYTRPDDYWAYAEDVLLMFYIDSTIISNSQLIPANSDWQEVLFHFTATAPIHQFSFNVTDGGGTCAYAALVIDNMSISKVTGIGELNAGEKTLIRIVDLMGRESEDKTNTLLIYIYSDGTSEKVFKVIQ